MKKLLKVSECQGEEGTIENFDLEAAIKAAQSAPVAQRGDIWLLGDHRLMCSDSTNPDDVA